MKLLQNRYPRQLVEKAYTRLQELQRDDDYELAYMLFLAFSKGYEACPKIGIKLNDKGHAILSGRKFDFEMDIIRR